MRDGASVVARLIVIGQNKLHQNLMEKKRDYSIEKGLRYKQEIFNKKN